MVCEDAKTNTNELEKAHAELQFLIVHITRKSDCAVYLENIQNLLEKSESSIYDLEKRLEQPFRRLVKTRVSLFSIFNH